MNDKINYPKTALTSLLDRLLAARIQIAYGLFSETDLEIAATNPDVESDNYPQFTLLFNNLQTPSVIYNPRSAEWGSCRYPSLTHFLIEEFMDGWKTLTHAY
jgi:hypothetical protein